MRIGFFTDSYFPEVDGVTYTLKLWRERLENRGHEVFIIYPDSEEYHSGDNEIAAKSLTNPFYSGYSIPLPVTAKTIPDNLDIVHCHTPVSLGITGRFYAWMKGVPTVYTHHTPLEEYFVQGVYSETIADLLGKLYVPLENRFIESFDTVTSNTEEIPRETKTEKLPAGVDLEFFRASEDFSFGIVDEKTLIGYSGRISPEKNMDEIIELAKEMDCKFLIIGEGPSKKKIKGEAPENVEFRDFIERKKLPAFYSALDVFVTASTGDTLGLSTLEANACNTPVVAADVYPFNETINEQNGERYEHGNVEDFMRKVEKCLESNYSTREAVKKYSLEKTVDRLEEIYRNLEDETYGN